VMVRRPHGRGRAVLVKLLDDDAGDELTTVDHAGRCPSVKRAIRRLPCSPDKAEVSGIRSIARVTCLRTAVPCGS
jgi:hypothetical protein